MRKELWGLYKLCVEKCTISNLHIRNIIVTAKYIFLLGLHVLQYTAWFKCVCGNQTSHIICSNIFCDTHVIYFWWKFMHFICEAWCVVGISINISAHQHSVCWTREWIMRSALFWIESHTGGFCQRAPVCVRQTQHELWPRLSSWNALAARWLILRADLYVSI